MAWNIPSLNYSSALIDGNAIAGIGDSLIAGLDRRRQLAQEREAAALFGQWGQQAYPGGSGGIDYASRLGVAPTAYAPTAPSQGLNGPMAMAVDPVNTRINNAFEDANYSSGLDLAPPQYRDAYQQAGQRYGVDPSVLVRMGHTESRFNPKAVSPKGAQGLMQFMPGTAQRFGIDPNDPFQSIDASGRYMAANEKMFGENTGLAAAGYNWGEGNVQRWLKNGADPARMPAETRNYVQSVTGQPVEQWVSNYRQDTPGTTAMAGDVAQPATGQPSRSGATIGMPTEASAVNAPRGMTINGIALPSRELMVRMLQNPETRPVAAQMLQAAHKGQDSGWKRLSDDVLFNEGTGETMRVGVGEVKPPTIQEFYDEQTGLPYKAQFVDGQWQRIGGAKAPSRGMIVRQNPDGSTELIQGGTAPSPTIAK